MLLPHHKVQGRPSLHGDGTAINNPNLTIEGDTVGDRAMVTAVGRAWISITAT